MATLTTVIMVGILCMGTAQESAGNVKSNINSTA